MPRSLSVPIAAALVLGLSIACAQDQRPAPEQGQQPQTGRGMGGMMGGMMQGDGMTAQMSRMMENCNKMMESHLQRHHQPQQQGR
jgi:predicted lipid-binding transport protein (Tim44 family)